MEECESQSVDILLAQEWYLRSQEEGDPFKIRTLSSYFITDRLNRKWASRILRQ